MELSKSRRVKVIQEISDHLSQKDWAVIDLTLKQFGLPIKDEWSGGNGSYVIAMVGEATNDELIELGLHCGVQFDHDLAQGPQELSYWKVGQLKVFISHISSTEEDTAAIKPNMSQFGMSAFVAHNAITPARAALAATGRTHRGKESLAVPRRTTAGPWWRANEASIKQTAAQFKLSDATVKRYCAGAVRTNGEQTA